VAGPSLATSEWKNTNAIPVQMMPSVAIEAIASPLGTASGMCSSPSGSVASAATACVPATVATGSTPPRFRLRYQAATA
jgi:hypothetical protein